MSPRPRAPVSEEMRAQQALEDLIVQVEIFLQYSLQTKAIERLERIAELFPGEEERNERLRALYERANWWPKGAPRKPAPQPAPPARPPLPRPALHPREPTPALPPMRFCALPRRTATLPPIAEINRLMYRQSTPREILAATAAEIGKYLDVTRCLVALGARARRRSIDRRVFRAGRARCAARAHFPRSSSRSPRLRPIARRNRAALLERSRARTSWAWNRRWPWCCTDKETGAQSGVPACRRRPRRKWKPNESFFLQAVGDQLVLSVNHTRLRSLVRSLAVADEKTGLLSRGAYVDCLLVESNRARSQATPLSLIILHVDHGGDLLRQHGDAAVDQYVEQLARALSSTVRQTDIAVKYTAWSLVFILPDTSIENARILAEKLRQAAATVQPAVGPAGASA